MEENVDINISGQMKREKFLVKQILATLILLLFEHAWFLDGFDEIYLFILIQLTIWLT